MEFIANTPRAALFAEWIDGDGQPVVPIITVHEIAKKLARQAGDETASMALSLVQRGQVIAVDIDIALAAASNGLALAASLLCATAQTYGAVLWAQDADSDGLPLVNYLAKPATVTPAGAPAAA